jgi:hypothetical protein
MQGIMKHLLPFLFLVTFVLWAPAEPPCATTSCSESVKTIADCPDDGCNDKEHEGHKFDQQLDKLKNIRSDNQQPVLRSIQSMKDLEKKPKSLIMCGSRDELKQLGEGQKITVVAWALTARPGSQETCNCDLQGEADTDNHIVLVDPGVKNPTLKEDEIHSVTAEFTPRVRLDHPNFTRDVLNPLIDPNWKPHSKKNPKGKLLVRVTGLLMFDSKHLFEGGLNRDTNWEIHPVLKMEVCPKGKTCRADSDENWKDLDND